MSSGDLMPRNLYQRVETFIPLENETVRAQVLEQVMLALLKILVIVGNFSPTGNIKNKNILAPSHTFHE